MSSIFIRSPSESSRTGWLSKSADVQQIDELVVRVLELVGRDAVDLLMEPERFGGGQVPPELVLLAHHEREPAAVGVVAFPGDEAEHACAGRRWD